MVGNVTVRRVVAALLAAGALTAGSTTVAAASTGGWQADLSAVDGDDVNVIASGGAVTLGDGPRSTGYLISAERQLTTPIDRVTARTTADLPQGTGVEVDVRGRTGADDWSEWTSAGTPMAHAVTVVQTRITLSGNAIDGKPTVRRVELNGSLTKQPRALAAKTPLTYPVYATREGLTGHATANGHVITSNDHFVALPSGKALSPKGTGSYSVRVCRTDDSRCEYAPVWDVGPWNTKDDYWNPPSVRAEFKDLPQGQPEAYAAYHNGYNGGRDDLGYRVGNPAGIDLADGVFTSGLGLSDNSTVKVTFLWTGSAAATGLVRTAGDPMNVRASASTSAAVKGLAANYARVNIECYVNGDSVTGTYGTSRIWDRIGPGHYLSDTYVQTGSDSPVAPPCA
ncbi:hypothetical protein [Amycolatopsis jejuensis]|uniref:hypothetical protein n=1 Tax=Amycolatopsis jejuensis TaxID=330084 RepID=UPI000527F5A2|nr:hypothetical protein [Amycolatopsis jejuensis]